MNHLKISSGVLRKLAIKHAVTRQEVEQCFNNRSGRLLMDTRESHKTDPPTLWFIALINQSRMLKVVYIQIDFTIHLKSVFSPNETEIEIYSRFG